jgi:hypothetical protein
VVIHGFLIVERMQVQIELILVDQLFRAFELRLEKLYENPGMGHQFMIFESRIN